MAQFCAACGTQVEEGMKFCSACGASIAEQEPTVADIGPVIGTHTGPGVIGVASYV